MSSASAPASVSPTQPASRSDPVNLDAIFNSRAAIALFALSAALILAQIWQRPLWRDEYWALYFSDPHVSALDLLAKIRLDVHPPLYFLLLHYWRLINDSPAFARLFNVAFLLVGGAAAWALRGPDPRRETRFWFMLCASSYWLIFYTAEARMMGAVFVLCGLSVLIVRRALLSEAAAAWAGAFAVIGFIAASMHFFATAWIASLGGVTGCMLLLRGSWRAFLAWGFASVLAVAPTMVWIALVRPDHNPGASGELPPLLSSLAYALNQFLRGLIVKTVLANCAAFSAAVLGFAALFGRGRDRLALVLGLACCLTVAIVFAIHFAWVPLIKERAFIVIMPALLYLAAASIAGLRADQERAVRLAKAAPIVGLLSLPLFSSQFFGDTDGISTVRALFAAAPQCAGQPVIGVMRRSAQGWGFSDFMMRESLAGVASGSDVVVAPLDTLLQQHRTIGATACPVKAVALALQHSVRADLAAMRDDLSRAGLDLSQVREVKIAGGRAYAWVSTKSSP
jgi:hypothetical protein